MVFFFVLLDSVTFVDSNHDETSYSGISVLLAVMGTSSMPCWFSTSSPALYWKNDSSPSSTSSGSVASVLTETVSKSSISSAVSSSSSSSMIQFSTTPLLSIVRGPEDLPKVMDSGFWRSPTFPCSVTAVSVSSVILALTLLSWRRCLTTRRSRSSHSRSGPSSSYTMFSWITLSSLIKVSYFGGLYTGKNRWNRHLQSISRGFLLKYQWNFP